MKEISDNELDALIRETVKREETLDSISNNVMQSVRQDARRHRARFWMRLAVRCFAVVTFVLLVFFPAYFIPHVFNNIVVTASMAFYAIVVMVALMKKVNDFMPMDV